MRYFPLSILSHILIFGYALLCSCDVNNESVSVELDKKSQVSLDLSKGDKLHFWSDIDIEYTDKTTVWYEITFYYEGDLIGTGEFDALNLSPLISEIDKTPAGKHYLKYNGKMTGSFTAKKDGKYSMNIKSMFKF